MLPHMSRCLTVLTLLLAATVPVPGQTVLVKPYVQPGDNPGIGPQDEKRLVWFTDQVPGEFTVDYGPAGTRPNRINPVRTSISLAAPQASPYFFRDQPVARKLFKYTATLTNLPLDARIEYRVSLRDQTIRTANFPSRKSPGGSLRVTLAGDMADGFPDQRKIAFAISRLKPDLMIVLGDIVYPSGTVSEYFRHFWNEYNNTDTADPTVGAPLMASIPWYVTLGNHDVWSHNLSFQPDGLAAFYFFHAPASGPQKLTPFTPRYAAFEYTMSTRTWSNAPNGFLPVHGPAEQVAAFKADAASTYPGLCFYAFENGPALFLCLDANSYTNPTDPLLHAWIRRQLTQSRARWKFVYFHHPGFHSSAMHYGDQRMRLLAPLFESCGVDIVFSGHIHNYQRSKPLRFQPVANDKWTERGMVDGQFTLDQQFDGATATRPDGVIYIVSGGGGAGLYPDPLTDEPATREYLKHNWIPFTARYVADRHSFTAVDLDSTTLTLRQIDEDGAEIERIKITKPLK